MKEMQDEAAALQNQQASLSLQSMLKATASVVASAPSGSVLQAKAMGQLQGLCAVLAAESSSSQEEPAPGEEDEEEPAAREEEPAAREEEPVAKEKEPAAAASSSAGPGGGIAVGGGAAMSRRKRKERNDPQGAKRYALQKGLTRSFKKLQDCGAPLST